MTDFSDLATLADFAALIDCSDGDAAAAAAVEHRDQMLTKPPGSLGQLETCIVWLARWQRRAQPRLDRAYCLIFAGNHGVTAQNISAFPSSVTAQMVDNFARGGAAINQLCALYDLRLRVHAFDLDRPTADITVAAALSEAECVGAIRIGMAMVPDDADIIALGEMGIGNTTAAAALYLQLFGGDAQSWCGAGTGIDTIGIAHKARIVAAATARCRSVEPHLEDTKMQPLQALQQLGGYEIAALTGAIVAARRRNIPVVLDGFVTTAAAAILHSFDPKAIAHCCAGHHSAEQAHSKVLGKMGLEPLLDLGLRLGEGSGAALAIGLIRAALTLHDGMATFTIAGVDQQK